MIFLRKLSRLNRFSRDRFPGDTYIKHNKFYETIMEKAESLTNKHKKTLNTKKTEWFNLCKKTEPYWVARFRSR